MDVVTPRWSRDSKVLRVVGQWRNRGWGTRRFLNECWQLFNYGLTLPGGSRDGTASLFSSIELFRMMDCFNMQPVTYAYYPDILMELTIELAVLLEFIHVLLSSSDK